jgi:PAS domain S-box-containing protein
LRDEALIFRDPLTGKRMTRGLLIDITERKRAEGALRESEERYRAFVEQSSEGIFRLEYDPPVPCYLTPREQYETALHSGYIAECNDAMAKLYGRTSARELIGRPISEFFILHDPVTKQFMEDFIRAGYRVSDAESRELDAKGNRKILRNTMAGVIADGKWVRTWGISRDVTERVHLEAQLRNAQQMEAIGRLAGGVAHDFNNILSIIMGYGELLLRTALDDRARNGVEQIRRAADRAASLTQQLLAFSRKQVLQPKVLDLNEAVSAVQTMLSRIIGEDIELVASLHPSLMPVKADPGQVEQVLMNLAINARDAMPQGGRITMQTANVQISPDQGRDLDLPAGYYVMLVVSDTGHGMDAATLPHIFEPFFTTKPMGKGTGLGLSMVYGIVKQSGGSVQVQSEPGHGTSFRVYLPGEQGARLVVDRHAADAAVARGSETVLIAEDEPDLRELTRMFLQEHGYKVIDAASAEQALKIADALSEPIHLLLTDVIMPGMSGRQLAERIQDRRPQTKIIYMTGYTDDMIVQHKVLEPGVNMLQKPFTRLDLVQKVRSTLDGE